MTLTRLLLLQETNNSLHGHDYMETQTDASSFKLLQSDPELRQFVSDSQANEEKLQTFNILQEKCQILTLNNVKSNQKLFKYYTGFPHYGTFEALFNYLEPKARDMKYPYGERTVSHQHFVNIRRSAKKPGKARSLELREEFFMTMVRLRLGIPSADMAIRFGISESTFSSIFTAWICLLSIELEAICKMPESIVDDTPQAECFSEFNNVRIVLDCTELFAETPSALSAHKQFYSAYKHHSTVKFLVGMNAGGAITYISKMYGGRSSDKFITNESEDLLDSLHGGEKVMVDRGFTISSDLPPGVELLIPSFKHKDKTQFSKEELRKNKKISEARVHIERAMRRIKQFLFLSKEMKLTQKDIYENIFKACGYLVNFQDPFLKV